MAFAITQSCCSDASCVAVCPVNCIHPTPDEPDFGTTDMLYVDPRACIDCGACADACPVDAIFPITALPAGQGEYAEINAAHYAGLPPRADQTRADDGWDDFDTPRFPVSLAAEATGLRVAIVGTGPSASYTAATLLTTSARVTMIDRLATPGGLVRWGVAPDHLSTKAIGRRFTTLHRNPRLTLELGVEVGTHVTHDQLLARHDAVVYAVGASADRELGVPGEHLRGSLAARTFVGWYNDHPEIAADAVDLAAVAHGRAVIVGNGNVALDMARILLGGADALAGTTVAAHALAALDRSAVTEVVLVGRRGPEHAAYTLSELRPLIDRDDVDVVVDGDAVLAQRIAEATDAKSAALSRLEVTPVDWSAAPTRRRLVLRFDSTVERVEDAAGSGRVDRVVLADGTVLPTGLLLRSVGYRSLPVPGLPFDEATHTVPHEAGRVVDPVTGDPVPATYVVGWIKRGPRGGIGTNRADAAETVGSLVADANAGVLGVAGPARSWLRRGRAARA